MFYDASKIRPRDGWCVVLQEPRKASYGSILIPVELNAEKLSSAPSRIVRTGPGEKNQRLGLEVGQRVVIRDYLKYANPVPTEERWPDGSEKRYFIVNSNDIVMIVAEGVSVGVLSEQKEK